MASNKLNQRITEMSKLNCELIGILNDNFAQIRLVELSGTASIGNGYIAVETSDEWLDEKKRFNQKYTELIIEAIKPVAYTELESVIDSILEKYDLNFGHKRIADNDGWMKFVFKYEKVVKDYDDAMLSFSILDRNYVDNREPIINCNQNLIKVKNSLLEGLENHGYIINESKIINIEGEEREIIYIKAAKELIFVIYFG